MEFKATGLWVALEDPREERKESQIYLPDEVKEGNIDQNEIKTNLLTVQSAGKDAIEKDPRLIPGVTVMVDPRAGFLLSATDEYKEEYVIIVPYQQIVMIQ